MKKTTFTRFFAILCGLFLLSAGNLLHSQSLVLRASADAVTWSEFPEQTAPTFHASNILANRYEVTEGETTTTHNIIAFVKFDISQFANRSISAASFSTRGTAAADTETTIRLRKAGLAFQRDTTHWGNKPSRSGELALKIYNTSSARRAYDPVGTALVDYINEELAKGSDEIAFSLEYKSGDFNGVNWIGGKGDGAWGPELTLEFDDQLVFFGIDDAVAFKEAPEQTGADFHASNIKVTKVDDNTETVSYIKFHLPGFAYKSVAEVEFSTRGTSQTDKEQVVQLRRTSTAFSRDTTNWSNRPSMSGKLATRVYNGTIGSARTVYTDIGSEIVNYINSELAKGNETIAFGLQYDSGDLDAGNWIGGVGDGAWGPMLKITPDNTNAAMYGIADAVAFSDLPDQTGAQWHATNILVAEVPEVRTVKSFVKFDISAFSGRVVEDVIFSTRSAMAADKFMTVKLTQAGNAFQRDTTNWGNMPSTSGELATVIYDNSSARKYFEQVGSSLVNYVNGKLASGANELSFGLEYKDGDGGDLNWIGGIGDATWGPYLELVFADEYNSFATDDAVVFEHAPAETAIFFAPTNIQIEDTDTTQIISFIKFNIEDLAGMEIDEVGISTRSDMVDGMNMTVKLMQAGTAFTRDTTNWNNKPSYSGELATVVLDDDSGRKYFEAANTSLVDYVNQHTLTGASEIAFALAYKDGAGGDLKWMAGAGDGSWAPQMELGIKAALEADTIHVMIDAYVNEADVDANFGDAADMGIRKSGDGTDLETLVKFDLTDVEDAIVGKVSLTAYIGQHDSGTQQDDFFVDVYAVEDTAWEEMTVTWTNKPTAGARLIEENVTWFGAGQDVVWTSDALTHYINDAIKAGKTHVSFVLKGKDNTPGNRLWMAGREWKPLATSLIFDYLTPPPPQNMPVVADSYVSQVAGETATNFGTAADQHLVNDDANEASKWIYFKYDLSNAYQEAISANLVVYGSIHNESPELEQLNFAVYSSNDVAWEEEVITWENKPAVNAPVLLTGTLLQGGRWFTLTSAAFTDYVNTAIDQGKEYITLVAKATDPTPGQRGWLSGKEWRASYITLNYEPEVALPRFSPNPGNFISSVDVTITTPTAGASIYYTTDNTDPSDTNGTLYSGPITLSATSAIETINVKAIGYAPELNPSGIVSATYVIAPVGLPQFSPTPLVSYQQSVEVTLSAEPAGSVIRYSTDGGAPTTLYDGPFLLTEPTLVKAQAFSSDFLFATEIVEANYDVVQTVPEPGIGPAGVGFTDLSRENQPALSLWLRAHDLDVADGEKVNLWGDISGNENHAHNDESAIDTDIVNTGEKWKAAPTMVADGLNGWPTVHFGTQIGGENADVKNLVVDDADNLDGGAGLSLFLVMKRNQMHGDFAAIFQKRDVRNQPAQASYVLEMDGGANPNKMQFVIARDIFLKSQDEFNADDYYLVNVALNSQSQLSSFMTDGVLKSSALYAKPIQNSHAPVIIGGFQPVDIAEIVLFNSDVNQAQNILVHNYLAAKYGLTNVDQVIYANTEYVYDIIGIGQATNMAGDGSDQHNYSSGGGLQLYAPAFAADGDFIMAAHNGTVLSEDAETSAWSRIWNVETVGTATNITMGFDFSTEGITSTPSASYKLWYKATAGEAWTDLGITPTVDESVLNFAVPAAQAGMYGVGINAPGSVNVDDVVGRINNGFSLYPNPARERVVVSLEERFSGNVQIAVRDMYGRTVRSQNIVKDAASLNVEFDLTGLHTGTYMIEVTDNNRQAVKLFMVK